MLITGKGAGFVLSQPLEYAAFRSFIAAVYKYDRHFNNTNTRRAFLSVRAPDTI